MENNGIPKLEETDCTPYDEKTIHQRYTNRDSFTWLMAEYDPETETYFGFANLNSDIDAEWGLIPKSDLDAFSAVLDAEWSPAPFSKAKILNQSIHSPLRRMEMTEDGKIKIIKENGNATYNYGFVPQGYFQVGCMFIKTDRRALNYAKKMNPNFEYAIVERKAMAASAKSSAK